MPKGIILAVAMAMLAAAGLAGQGKSPAPAKAGKAAEGKLETATFAGGCFWCMQPPFDKTRGVVSTVVGYTGGKEKNPTYEQVSSGRTGHRESIQVTFDPAQVTYEQLVDVFWHNINPTQADGQFADIGAQYRTAVFYRSEEQKRIAEESKAKLGKSGKFSKPIAAEILPEGPFYPAEEYHQKYYQKNPEHYRSYAVGSGRYPFLERTWGIKKE
jgi:methionine-S-sulfoxide reductase